MKTQNPSYGISSGAGGQNVAGYVGEITYFADNILRKNHIWADGAAIDATQWPELAEYAATAGWTQNDAGQYLTPNLRGRFLLGASEGHAVGETGGEETVTLTIDEMPAHTHGIKSMANGAIEANRAVILYDVDNPPLVQQTKSTGGSQPHNNMPPFYTVSAQIRAKVDVIQARLTTCPYEVGDILQTKSVTHPSERWPGTEWAAIETFLLGASEGHTVGETGGEETHTLTVEEMPSHAHTITLTPGTSSSQLSALNWESATSTQSYPTKNTGGSAPHNNMPPYTTVYIWERTA